MKVLVVNGFEEVDRAATVDLVESWLASAGHESRRLDLAAAGFDRFMTAAEREAYHTDQPLVTDETRAAAAALQAVEAVVICYPIVHLTAPPRVKNWQERVFVLGLAFRFAPSGRITGALDHLHRALVLGVDDPPDRAAGRRNAFGPCLARSFVLSSNRTCRSRYLTTEPGGSPAARRAIDRW